MIRATRLADVATAAGVSMATASRVLNGSTKNVTDELRVRVEEVARRLGYAANTSAQAVAGVLTPHVALLLGDLSDPYFTRLAGGVQRAADDRNMSLSISVTGHEPARETRIIQALRGSHPRVVILAASRTVAPSPDLEEGLRALEHRGTRIVSLGAGRAARTVLIPNHRGAFALGHDLAGAGYRSASVVAGPDGLVVSDDRVGGFSAGFHAGGGRSVSIARAPLTHVGAREATHRLLDAGLSPATVIFAVTDLMALGASAAVEARGLAVGADVAVAGFIDVGIHDDASPPLTSVHLPLAMLGEAAVIAGLDETAPPSRSREFLVHLRASTPVIA